MNQIGGSGRKRGRELIRIKITDKTILLASRALTTTTTMTKTNERETKPTMWPILFRYKGPVIGKGFIADIELCGRLLAEVEADGVWLYGVNPGAFAVEAQTIAQASTAVTKSLTAVFVDFAEEMGTFETFKAEVERFFKETDRDTQQDWLEAVQAVRSGVLRALPGLPVKSTKKARFHVTVTNRPVDTLTPDDNRLSLEEERPTLAAAA
jgi:hypothetical protein